MPPAAEPPPTPVRPDPRARPFGWPAFALWCALIGWIWLTDVDHRPLHSPDEGRYAEMAREMAASGDWVTPRLNGLKYFEKPPLQLWLTAAGFSLFGVSDAVARWVPALYGLGVCLVVAAVLGARAGAAAAQAGALVAAGTCWIVANAHFISLDMGLCFWLTVALAGWIGCFDDARDAPQGKPGVWPSLLAWVGMAGAFLSKGLVGLVIPGAAVCLSALLLRRPALIGALRWWPGVAVFAAMVAPWLVNISLREPGFMHFFFVHEHFERFTSEVHRRIEPIWYFLPVFLAGGLPWLGHWLAAARLHSTRARADSTFTGGTDPVDTLLLAWTGFIFVFFSVSGSKLPSYILPMYPALAIWFARRWQRIAPASLARAHLLAAAAGLLIAAAAGVRLADGPGPDPMLDAFLPWVAAAGGLLIVGGLVSWRISACHPLAGIAVLALAGLLAMQSLNRGHAVYGERSSSRELVQRLLAAEGAVGPEVPFYAVATYDQTLPWYLRRTVTLVDWRDEMDLGLRAEPALAGPTAGELMRRWPTFGRAYALLDLSTLRNWQAAGVPLRVVARNDRRAVIATAKAQ